MAATRVLRSTTVASSRSGPKLPTTFSWMPRLYFEDGNIDELDRDLLIKLGADIPDRDTPLFDGKCVSRPPNGSCAYHSLIGSNDVAAVEAERVALANYIHINQNSVIGNTTFITSIQDAFGSSVQSVDYRDHMLNVRPFGGQTDRGAPWAGVQEIIAFAMLRQRRVEVYAECAGPDRSTVYRLQWSYGNPLNPITRIVHSGRHFDSLEEADPFLPARRPRNRGAAPAAPIQAAPPTRATPAGTGRLLLQDGASDSDAIDEAGARAYIGRDVIKDFDGGAFTGKVVRIRRCDGRLLFAVDYEDGDNEEYYLEELLRILVPEGVAKEFLKHKKIYAAISDGFANGTASPSNLPFLAKVFSFRKVSTITVASMKGKHRKLQLETHYDKTRNLPPKAQYVAKMVNSASFYYFEHYKHSREGTSITRDPPVAADFPRYGSPEFIALSGLAAEDLTPPSQMSPGPGAGGGGSGDGQGETDDESSDVPEARDGSDAPAQPSALPDDFGHLPNDISILDHIPHESMFCSPFHHVMAVPFSCIDKWGTVAGRALAGLIEAADLPQHSRANRTKLDRALKLYAGLPQLIFRNPGRGHAKNAKIIHQRLDQFIAGEFRLLFGPWGTEVRKFRLKTRKAQVDTEESRRDRAVELIYQHNIGKGINIIEGFGRAEPDDPDIKRQMKEKHPAPKGADAEDWPDIPDEWLGIARESVESDAMLKRISKVVRETDPTTSVGPRGLHYNYLSVLFTGHMSTPESKAAKDRLGDLAARYLSCGLPAWARRLLGGGLLTPLVKKAPAAGCTPDARPVKAEDADTSSFCKALNKQVTSAAKKQLIPQQLGIGVSGGIQITTIGLAMKYEEAKNKRDDVFGGIDVKNAHNAFPQRPAFETLIDMARKDEDLIPLVVAMRSTLWAQNDIYMRSRNERSGFTHLCRVMSGGGQGNGLTSVIFAGTINKAVKDTEARFPGVEIKCIHDDISILGPASICFDTEGREGALTYLTQRLEGRGLTINEDKYQFLATSDEARARIPERYAKYQPCINITDPVTGLETKAYGIEVCNVPIGDPQFVAGRLQTKFEQKCSAIKKSSDALTSVDRHAAFQALQFSYQARFDYWFSTLPLNLTRPYDSLIQACLDGILGGICGTDPFSAPAGCLDAGFVSDRIFLKCRHGGLGIRPMAGRASLLNGLNCSLPQMIDRVGEDDEVTQGLWNSLSSIIGAGSFDEANITTCWATFHASGSIFASDHLKEIGSLKTRYRRTLEALGEDPSPDSIFSAPDTGFGGGSQKLHKKLMDELRGNEARLLRQRAEAMPRDDPRAEAFLCGWQCPFANRFPLTISPEVRFTSGEFITALCRKMGLPIPLLLTAVGVQLSNNANCVTKVGDAYGHAYTTVTGAKGDHVRTLHDTILAYLIDSVASAGIPCKGGFGNTCKNLFAHCIFHNLESDDDERRLQGIIPDMMLNCSLPPGQPANALDGCRQLVELKTCAQRNMSVEERAVKIQRDVEQHAKELDARDPRNRVHAELMSYGVRGQYVALVVGRFGEFSKDFIKLRDYIARQRASAYVGHFSSSITGAMSMFKLSSISRWSLMAARCRPAQAYPRSTVAVT